MAIFRRPDLPERFKVFFRDPDKKSFLQCLNEFLILSLKKKEIAFYYFEYLYKKQIVSIHDYLSTNERTRIHRDKTEQSYEYLSILNNRLNFAIYFDGFGLNTPKLITYNFGNKFYHENRVIQIRNVNHLREFLIKVLKIHDLEELFIRPISAMGEKECLKLTLDNLCETIQEKSELILNGDCIYTQVIEQHPDISRINNALVNTIQFLTLNSETGEPELISAAMKFGPDDAVVGNVSADDFFVGIDIQTGTLNRYGWRKQLLNNGELLEKHPLSGIRLEGFKIPYFEQACSMVLKATQYLPNVLTEWNVAIQKDRPILVDGNHDPDLIMTDLAHGGLLKNKSFKEFVQSAYTKS